VYFQTRQSQHVLQFLLSERHRLQYNLRTKPHDKLLITTTSDLNDRDMLV